MNLRQAAEQALKALEEINKLSVGEKAVCLPAEIDGAMEALRQALAQPDLARVGEVGVWGHKHEWVGLTDDDIHDAFNYVEMVKLLDFDRDRPEWCEAFARACEARLRHRNGEKQ